MFCKRLTALGLDLELVLHISSPYDLQEHQDFDRTCDSSLETSSDSDALDFDLEVESWRARLANFITEIHAHADTLLAEEEWLKITKAKRKKTRNKRTTFREDLSPQYTL